MSHKTERSDKSGKEEYKLTSQEDMGIKLREIHETKAKEFFQS